MLHLFDVGCVAESKKELRAEELKRRTDEAALIIKTTYRCVCVLACVCLTLTSISYPNFISLTRQVPPSHVTVIVLCSECPSFDRIIPVLLKEGIEKLPDHCHLTPGEPEH